MGQLDDFKHYASVHDEILAWYDGYSWDGESRLINPYSLLSFFMAKEFSGFWYASGTPKFLMDLMKKKPFGYIDFDHIEMGEWDMDAFDIDNIDVVPLMFQTGYLTIKAVLDDMDPAVYSLSLPNFEVRQAFSLHLLAEFTENSASFARSAYMQISNALKAGDFKQMLITLKALFASIPYELHISREAYYHSIFYAVMSLLGFDVEAEVSTAHGSIDAVLELEDKAYVMEFKYRGCPPDALEEDKRKLFEEALEEGMAQIKGKGYADKFIGSSKTVYLAAFAFLGRDDIDMRAEML